MTTEILLSLRLKLHDYRGVALLVDVLRSRTWKRLKLSEPLKGEVFRFQSDGFQIVGDLHEATDTNSNQTIIILHGTSHWGRKSSIIQVLALAFLARQYNVVTLDIRGYGQSDKPMNLNSSASYAFGRDVVHAVEYLKEHWKKKAQYIHVIGHSFGAGVALDASRHEPGIDSLVLFGPPRRLRERFFCAGAPDRQFIIKRMRREMRLHADPDVEQVERSLVTRDIEQYVQQYQGPDHVPLMLIDAEKESKSDLQFLRDVYSRMDESVAYWTVPDSNHYLNTGYIGPYLFYQAELIETFVDHVDAFVSKTNRSNGWI